MSDKTIYVLEYKENKFMMLLPDSDKHLLDSMGIRGDETERYVLNQKQYAYLRLRYTYGEEIDIINHMLKEVNRK